MRWDKDVALNAFTFAEYPGVSRHLVFDLRGGNPEHYLNTGLDWLHAGFTHNAFWESLPPGTFQGLAPRLTGRRRFGVVVGAPEEEGGELDPRFLLRVETTPVQMCIFQEWNPARAVNAWDALLIAQDALRPQLLAAPPGFLVSLIALAKLAVHEVGFGSNVLARWRLNIALAQRVLSPVINEMMQAWLAGPTRAAARYRAQMRLGPQTSRPPSRSFVQRSGRVCCGPSALNRF